MFAGNKRRSSNVKVMQLFHELKQQFPTIPDHVVTSCITAYAQSSAQDKNIVEYLETTLAENNVGQMGRSSQQLELPPLDLSPNPQVDNVSAKANLNTDRTRTEMDESASDINRNTSEQTEVPPRTLAKRPNYLNIKSSIGDERSESKKTFNIQLSEKCKDVHKLLNSELSEKPPRSPLSAKRFASKNSPTKVEKSPDVHRRSNPDSTGLVKKETCSTPTQTTDTLIGSPNVNLSLNVNCSVDVLQSPTQQRRTAALQLTPTQPWLQTPTSPRSFTSVNLTLRPPASIPQDPIDITSQNSSLTYSTSSYDSQKGLQSRLQITVGPGNGSVSSLRVRPKSYHPQEQQQEVVPVRAGSLNNLAVNSEPPVALKQQARIERLRIELNTEKAKLVIMKQEIDDLEKSRLESEINAEVEKQLLREIKHLRFQCNDLELDGEAFYNNIYTGQDIHEFPIPPPRFRQNSRRRLQYQPPPDYEGPKWNCDVCTFLNHPSLDKCEQCDFPRILHGTKKSEAVNPNLTFDTLRMLNNIDVGRATRSLSLNNVPQGQVTRPIGFVLNENEQPPSLPAQINTSRSVPNMLKEFLSNKNKV